MCLAAAFGKTRPATNASGLSSHRHGAPNQTIQILPRTTNLEAVAAPSGPPPEQDVPIPVPPVTRLFVEQTQVKGRERAERTQLQGHNPSCLPCHTT